jgi:hypothetical protein
LTDPAELRRYFGEDTLQYPAVPELPALDVTSLSPQESAARIEHHIEMVRESLKPADSRHLQLR